MPRIEDVERRLRRWARWKPGGSAGGLGFSSCDMTSERVDGDGHGAVYQEGEEAITDMAIDSLDEELKETVYVYYLGGGKRERMLQHLGYIADSTLDTRIWRAHAKLSGWFTDRRQRADQERARVEALQRAGVRK